MSLITSRQPNKYSWAPNILIAIISCLILLLTPGFRAAAQDTLDITTESLAYGTVGKGYSQTLVASGGTPPYTWTIPAGHSLPDWAELNSETGIISGTPDESGTTTFVVQVSDSSDASAEQSLSLTIHSAITVTTFVLQPGAEDLPYNQTLAATGGTGNYTWSVSSGNLPSGLSLSSSGRISGDPSKAGVYIFTVQATDASGSNSGSRTFKIAIQEPGYLYTWGDNSKGQLGNNTTTSRNLPVQVSTINNNDIFSASSGGLHSLAVDTRGDVWSWGDNAKGQLGLDSTTNKSVPQRITDLRDVTAVSAGYQHSLALDDEGTVWAWGDNSNGQLGINSTVSFVKTPEEVENLENIVAISCGYLHSLALKSDGTVWAWGYNNKGQLGNNSTTTSRSPVQVRGTGGSGYLTGIVAISAGHYHNLALSADGRVFAWGDNSCGQLGNNSSTVSFKSPVTVNNLEDEDIISLAAGGLHSLALGANGDVWAWGYNNKGQLGIGNTTSKKVPTHVSEIDDIEAIAAGSAHSLAIDDRGRLWAWGDNAKGQLGTGSTTQENSPEYVDDFGPSLFITAGVVNTLAVSEDELEIIENLSITTASLPDGEVDDPYSQTLKASGGSGDYKWERTSGSLPPGLSLNSSSGKISGTPTKAGEYTFKITVTDNDNDSLTASKSFTIEIGFSDKIDITTGNLPDGKVDVSYSQTLKASGGSGDYEWERTSGSLPPGLSLNSSSGKISGTPTKAGEFTFRIKVTDTEDDSLTDTASLSIKITEEQTSSSAFILSGLSSSSPIELDKDGLTRSNYQLNTTDKNVTLAIPDKSRMRESTGGPLAALSVIPAGSPPTPPIGSTVVSAYTFGPDGASFSPPITVYFKYKQADLPAGVDEKYIYLAFYNNSRWERVASTVDPNTNTVAAILSHFSTYAVMADTTGAAPTSPTSSGTPGTPETPAEPSAWWVMVAVIAGVLIILLIGYRLFKSRQWGTRR